MGLTKRYLNYNTKILKIHLTPEKTTRTYLNSTKLV